MKDINGFINDKVNVAIKENGSIYIGNIPDDNLEHYKIIIDAPTFMELIKCAIDRGGSVCVGHYSQSAAGQIVIGNFDNPINPEKAENIAVLAKDLPVTDELKRTLHPGHPCEF